MSARGFDLLAIDLPGVGSSSQPRGHSVTLPAVARAVSDMIASVRTQGLNGAQHYRFEQIALIGHSLGAMVSVFAEANWPAADFLVVQGVGFYPGRATSGWEPGVREALMAREYALLPPEERLKFYHLAQTDPDVVTYDNEVLRTSMPSRLWGDTIALRDDRDPGASRIRCPVYVQLGDEDPIMFGQYAEQEAKGYTSAKDVTVDRLADMGHCFNLHLNKAQSWSAICRYFDRRLPGS
jgi:pimeloyl-ACP methyl ester carboxylesterase